MNKFIHFKNTLILLIFLLFLGVNSKAQTIYLEIGQIQHTMQETNVLGDCTRGWDNANLCCSGSGCGGRNTDCGDAWAGPEWDIRFRFNVNGVDGGENAYYSGADRSCGDWRTWGSGNYAYQGNTSYTGSIIPKLGGREVDDADANDGDCYGASYAASSGTKTLAINTICPNASGTWSAQYTSNIDNCNSDGKTNDYRLRWQYRYYFVSGFTAGSIDQSDQNVCVGYDPLNMTSSGFTSCFASRQWQVNSGSGWTNVGVTGTTYDPGVISTPGTYQYRCQYGYYVNFSGGISYVYSNVRTINVVADPSPPSATKSPNVAEVCVGQVLSLTSPSKGVDPGQSCQTFEYRTSTNNGGTWSAWSTVVPNLTSVAGNLNLIEIRVQGGCATACNASAATQYSWNVVADPVAPTLNVATPTSGSTICIGASVSATFNAGTIGTGSCTDEYQYTTDGGGSWSAYTPGASISASSAGANRIQIQSRRVCDGLSCDGAGETWATKAQWTVVADPVAPTITASPNTGTVCAGTTLTVTPSGGTGGTGTCNSEYRIDIGNGAGFGAWSTSVPSTTAVTGQTVTIESRRNCDGLGCNSNVNSVSWTVVAQPVGPTLNTATPTSGSEVCVGGTTSATVNSGSGGVGCTDDFRVSTNAGSTWAAYTPGNNITAITSSIGANGIIVEGRRASCTPVLANCTGTAYLQLASWNGFAQPTNPTLNAKLPNVTNICAGETVSATLNTGTGGSTGAIDDYRYSIDGGTSWATYTSGDNINTTTATGSVIIQGRRSGGSGTGCITNSYSTLASWTVYPQIVAPTLNVATPSNGTNICLGQSVSATITAGSGGLGASDLYERSIDGGTNWIAYSSGSSINTGSATGSVQIRVSRSAGSGTGCNATGPTVIATWPVYPQVVAPTLNTKTPNVTDICAGQAVNATINAGSGGAPGAADSYEVSIDGGTSWAAYTSGSSIATGSATGSVQVRVSRSNGGGTGCTATGPTVVATWTVSPQIVAPTLNVKTPNATNVCAGTDVNATITAGSGGVGATDTYEYSVDGGAWTAYTSGNNISTTGITNVQIRASRSAGTGTGCTATGPTVIATWNVDEYPAGTPNLSALYLCDLTAKLEVTGITPGGSTVAWTKSSGTGTPTSSSDNPLNVTGLTQGTTTVYNATLTNGTCTNISIGSVSIIVPTRNFSTITTVDECGYCVLTDGNVRTFFGPSGNLICRIEDVGNGTDLDETDACDDVYGSVPTVYTAQLLDQPFLPRRLVITPNTNSDAIVRFYFTTAEYNALQSACSGTPFEFSSPSALRVTKFDGAYTDPPNHPVTDASATLIFPTVSTTSGGYYAEFAVSSFSTFYIHSNMWPFAPLPVELKSFTGYHNGQVNVLDWITASEQNTNRFEIQKSLDAQSWESIGTVAAAGNSLVDMSYTFNDGNAINGTNYYRLKMIDNDESFTYSSIVKIDVNNAVIVNGIAQVFPNPTKGLLNVWVSSSKAEDVTFTVTDILGRSVQTVNKQLETGLNKLDFNFDKLASGTYIINYLDANSQRHYHKFIKD
jgi:hypothetical protein